MKRKITVEWLSALEDLKGVPEAELQWFVDQGTVLELPAGACIFKPGDELPGPFVIISGKVRLLLPHGNEMREEGVYETGAIGGNMPFSRGKIANVITEVVDAVSYFQFPLNLLNEMIQSQFGLTQALVHVMANRILKYTAFAQQNEKMMALGKLSAGLAHELNNPAAAVVRGCASLLKHLKLAPDRFKQVLSLRLDSADVNYVIDKLLGALSATERPVLNMMERAALEDAMLDRLEEHRVPEAAEIAEILADLSFSTTDLDDLLNNIPAQAFAAVFGWINSNLVTEKIAIDMQEASGRIAALVGSIKVFTHMDQGHGKQYADIHIGIRNTIIMLQHKIRSGNVQIIENFDTGLPPVKAMIGELNQVWTNLLDNALDAMEPNKSGVLTITTGRAKDSVRINISDNGPGIPDDVKSKIFEPFFTTKAIGKGTGLGLDVVMRIIRQHKGDVKVQSKPGQTDFIVEFPIDG